MSGESEPRATDPSPQTASRDANPPTPISWPELRAEERRRIDMRRQWLKNIGRGESLPDHHVGLALSGGGIRSATFSLGVLRALSRIGILDKVDYLSTVSGGGYAGTFYCSLFVPHPLRGAIPLKATELAIDWGRKRAEELGSDVMGGHIGQRAIEQLREGGHFLNPNGTSDALFAAVVAIRNWFALALITGLLLLCIFLAANLPRLADIAPLRNSMSWSLDMAGVGPRASSGRETATRSVARPLSASINCAADLRPARGGMSARCSVTPPDRPQTARTPVPDIGRRWGASWLWLAAAILLPLWVFPTAWAFWLTRTGSTPGVSWSKIPESKWLRLFSRTAFVALITALLVGAILWLDRSLTLAQQVVGASVVVSAVGGILAYGFAQTQIIRMERGTSTATATVRHATLVAEEDRVRTKLSRWLFRSVFTAAALAALALTDDVGRAIYHMTILPQLFPTVSFATGLLGSLTALVVPVARWVLKRAQASDVASWPRVGPLVRRFGRWLALITGLLLLFAILSFWSALSYAVIWHGRPVLISGPFGAWPNIFGENWLPPILITIFVAICTLILGRVHGFLNQTSLASFYAARLRKAYLGASNVERIASRAPADLELPTDEIELTAYYHEGLMAPVHLINVTVNETTSESSRVIQRDRKGKGMTVSPAGYIFVRNAPTTPPEGFPLDSGEQLPVSSWMGISGAAFSTGMGQHTSLGLSLLAGLTNLRLGYWWNSPHPGRWREFRQTRGSAAKRLWRPVKDFFGDLVQTYVLRELRDDHEGTHSNRWYLSDGGHFDNSGMYELVRRRVPFIIACDNGADPSYEFADFVNFVRKIRIDFNAETELVAKEELDRLLGLDTTLRRAFGTLEEMVPRRGEEEKGHSHAYAALARIKHLRSGADQVAAVSTLLLIKPRVVGEELPDLLRYKKSNIAFPQQPTTDLFFDEAQWESYYRLGQLIAESIFLPEGAEGFRPRRPLKRAPVHWHPARLQLLP